MNKLTTTNIKYLIAINQLYNNQNGVRCTDLANMLGVSKPSVHRMIETMKNIGLIDKDRYGEIFLHRKDRSLLKNTAVTMIRSATACGVLPRLR